MAYITEDMIRKRAEHNNCELSTLEEVSLHQQDIIKIEYLDKWCRELKILYLQSNLIPKIENVKRLKKLEYINLALNNVERIENLEGCESLRKLDLTVNHVRELTSIESLRDLIHLREIYLTGNPCTDFEGYREYVVATLPQLQTLDGTPIHKSERIAAIQRQQELRRIIVNQQREALKEREKQKADYAEKQKLKEEKDKQKEARAEKKPGFDGRWYTDINKSKEADDTTASPVRSKIPEDAASCSGKSTKEESTNGSNNAESELERQRREDAEEKAYWEEKSDFTPESRLEVHKHLQEQKRKENREEVKPKRERRLFYEDGRAFNINEPKVQFHLDEDVEEHRYRLDLALWKHLDTSLVDADVQPHHVRVTIKGKVFQLHLEHEVLPDSSSAQRSQTTGHLLLTMPKAGERLVPSVRKKKEDTAMTVSLSKPDAKASNSEKSREFLEVDSEARSMPDVASIVSESDSMRKTQPGPVDASLRQKPAMRADSPGFIDDPNVPPLM